MIRIGLFESLTQLAHSPTRPSRIDARYQPDCAAGDGLNRCQRALKPDQDNLIELWLLARTAIRHSACLKLALLSLIDNCRHRRYLPDESCRSCQRRGGIVAAIGSKALLSSTVRRFGWTAIIICCYLSVTRRARFRKGEPLKKKIDQLVIVLIHYLSATSSASNHRTDRVPENAACCPCFMLPIRYLFIESDSKLQSTSDSFGALVLLAITVTVDDATDVTPYGGLHTRRP